MKKIKYVLLIIACFTAAVTAFGQNFGVMNTPGTMDQYAPVVFNYTGNSITISRPNVHQDRLWLAHGVVNIFGIGYGWGSYGQGLRVENFSIGWSTTDHSSPRKSFVGKVMCSRAYNSIIVYLKGGTTYYTNGSVLQNTGTYEEPIAPFSTPLGPVATTNANYGIKKGVFVADLDVDANSISIDARLSELQGIYASQGNVGIGTRAPKETLSVNGKIRAHEIKVETSHWPDYVFQEDYDLKPLQEIDQFIKNNGHLPEIPTASEVEVDGISLGEMNKLLLKKIEELTLHLIEKDQKIEKLSSSLLNVMDRVENIEKIL